MKVTNLLILKVLEYSVCLSLGYLLRYAIQYASSQCYDQARYVNVNYMYKFRRTVIFLSKINLVQTFLQVLCVQTVWGNEFYVVIIRGVISSEESSFIEIPPSSEDFKLFISSLFIPGSILFLGMHQNVLPLASDLELINFWFRIINPNKEHQCLSSRLILKKTLQ